MRNALCQALIGQAADPRFVFLTGDLGFQALEPLRDALGERFLNAGIAEQNMVSVAAGLAHTGMRPWVYSIAPFVYARPYEQIRNDICLHRLPVRLLGNGGGYAYGVMGSTHHAIEDYGTLLGLPGMRVFVPAFGTDLPAMIERLADDPGPAYVRLGRCELPKDAAAPGYAAWRCLLTGDGPTMVVVGPLAGGLLVDMASLSDGVRPNVWVVTELPLAREQMPEAFIEDLRRSEHLVVVEEHVAAGSAGQMLAHRLLESGDAPRQFTHRHAAGYVSGLYGSQSFHRRESGLDPRAICTLMDDIADAQAEREPRQTVLRLARAA